ncbi:MAG: TMEM198/TM7SF3 family protein [Chloroflexota bacterium]|nr:TMEM198/TM7SF3 family protein [Chloroflexota bacterium]
MEQVIIGILLALIGLGVCFFGLRYWFILLPIFGAVTGFFVGARVVQEVFGTGFLSTGVSWIVGIIVGLVFALLSWFVWYAGAIIMAGAVGASLFSGILHAIFTNPWGIMLFIVALIGAILFAAIALFLNLPIYIVIVNSALGGAALAVAGVLVLIGSVTITELSTGAAVAVADEVRFQGAGILWYIVWIVLAILGMLFQVQSVSSVTLPEEKWVPARAD